MEPQPIGLAQNLPSLRAVLRALARPVVDKSPKDGRVSFRVVKERASEPCCSGLRVIGEAG